MVVFSHEARRAPADRPERATSLLRGMVVRQFRRQARAPLDGFVKRCFRAERTDPNSSQSHHGDFSAHSCEGPHRRPVRSAVRSGAEAIRMTAIGRWPGRNSAGPIRGGDRSCHLRRGGRGPRRIALIAAQSRAPGARQPSAQWGAGPARAGLLEREASLRREECLCRSGQSLLPLPRALLVQVLNHGRGLRARSRRRDPHLTGREPGRLQQPQRGLQMRPSLMTIPCAVGSSGEPCVGM